MTTIILAIVIGAAFGATLDRIGATNPSLIGKMLNFTNLHLMKTILLAIGTGSVLMFGGQMFGIVEVGHMSVKAAYVGVFIGGLLLGAGRAVSGYCPGTGICAAASGRKDACEPQWESDPRRETHSDWSRKLWNRSARPRV